MRTTAGSKWVATTAAMAAGLLLLPNTASAKTEGAQDKTRPPLVDPRADALLEQMGAYLAESKEFSFRADIDFDQALPSGQLVELSALEDVAVRRPDRAYVEYQSDLGAKRFWYDGKTATMLDGAENVYASTAVPGKIDAAIEQLLAKNGFQPPLSDFLYANPYTVLKQHAQFGAYLGLRDAGGVRCHHLAFVDKTFDWQIWIEDGTQAVPRKLLIIYRLQPGAPRFEALFSDWKLDERLPNSVFTPLIPDGAVKMDFTTLEREEEGGR